MCVHFIDLQWSSEKKERFKLGLFRQIAALACLIHCNGSNQIHKFLRYLLTLSEPPFDILQVEFLRFFHEQEH
jgi:hypothetical protein